MTPLGRVMVAVAVVCVFAGSATGYRELVALGAGLCTPVAVALVGGRRGSQLDVARLITPDRVPVGGDATSTLTLRNGSTRRLRRPLVTETIGSERIPLGAPTLAPGDTAAPITVRLPTERRGIYPVGPLRLGRPDPFGLLVGTHAHGAAGTLAVHPRVHVLDPLGAGHTRDLDGATADHAREGGVAFHGLRNYVQGDDVRLIDWRATARSAGQELYVRQYVEAVRPELDVLVDIDPAVHDPAGFELALEAAASIAVSALSLLQPVRLATTGNHDERGAGRFGSLSTAGPHDDAEEVLDLLARLELDPGPTNGDSRAGNGPRRSLAECVTALPIRDGGHNLVVVTGAVPDAAVAAVSDSAVRFARVVVIRADPNHGDGEVVAIGRSVVVTVSNAAHLVRAWSELSA